jgi:hypothetical protein
MKRFTGILLLCLLSYAVNADTTGVYSVMLRGKVIATATEFDTIDIRLIKDSVTAADTLHFGYYSCGSFMGTGYSVIVTDSHTQAQVFSSGPEHHDFLLPLRDLLLYDSTHPGAALSGRFQGRVHRHIIHFRLTFI